MRKSMEELDVVKAKRDLSEKVKKGSVGTIVMVFNYPNLAYEVEFIDDFGYTIDVITVDKNDIIKI